MVNEDAEDLHGPHYTKDSQGNDVLLIRKSMIEDYIMCPWKFKRIWIDGVKKVPNQDMIVGTRYHDFMQAFFEHMVPEEYWLDMIPDEFIETERQWAAWTIEKERERKHFLESQGRGDEFLPVKLEYNMVSPRLYLESRPDRIEWFNKEAGQMCAVEYKTGNSVNWESIKRQLALYAILWDDVVKLGKITHIKLINPQAGIYRTINLDTWEKDRVYKTIGAMRKALKEGIYPHKCNEVIYAYCLLCKPEDTGLYPEDDGLTFQQSLDFAHAMADELI